MTDAELYSALARLLDVGQPLVLATVVATQGSCPQKPGAKLAVLPGGEQLGTVGGGAIEKQIVDAALALLQGGEGSRLIETHLTHDLGMCCGGKMSVFLERQEGGARLALFGAGHVHREVAALAERVGFRVTVVDEREEWLTAERFPRATRIQEDPAVAAARLELGPADYACVATHEHPLDERVLKALGARPLRYLGMIGSQRKALRFRERLLAQGLPEEAVARFQSPMGLEIGAQTPEEIAVSVVGELIRVRRGGSLGK